MRRSAVDSCVYCKKKSKDWLIAATFVDDVTYFGTDKMCEWFEQKHRDEGFKFKFSRQQEGFLGMEIIQKNSTIQIRQKNYLELAYKKFGEYIKDRPAKKIPLPHGKKLEPATDGEYEEAEHLPYKALVATIQVAAKAESETLMPSTLGTGCH